jgi:hypothetical protein
MRVHIEFLLKILKRPCGRPRRRCEDNIKMDLREREWKVMNWIHLTQDRE